VRLCIALLPPEEWGGFVVAVNGIYQLKVIGTVLGQQHIHSLHFRSTTDPDGVAMSEPAYQQGLIDAWQSAARTAYRGCFHDVSFPCQNYQVRKVCGSVPLPGGIDEAEAGGTTQGTRSPTTAGLASWLAIVTTIRTAYAGRSYRGRFFLGGLDENDADGDQIVSGHVARVQSYVDTLTTAFVTPLDVDNPFRLFVFSRKLAEGSGVACQNAGADAINFQVRTGLATMKSRKKGSGI
jgi:hypothetical protein